MLPRILTAVFLLTASSAAAGDDPWTYHGDELGVSISLPGRERQIQALPKDRYERTAYKPVKLGGREAQLLEYRYKETTVRE